MTVGAEPGDTGGDLVIPAPARASMARDGVCSPEWLSGSRFWMLQTSDDEDEDEGHSDRSSAADDRSVSDRYFCRTPLPVSDADLDEDTAELTRRHIKRIKRRDDQRMAARTALTFVASEGTSSSPSLSLGRNSGSTKIRSMPVLVPSVFLDDDAGGWTVVRRRRWSPAIEERLHDPRNQEVSKNLDVGLLRSRAGVCFRQNSPGPNCVTQGVVPARLIADRGPRLVKIGSVAAGHAFRGLLGLAWKRCETGAPLVPPQRLVSMDGNGGQEGFNPGRGGFNAGRGGFGNGRGGFGPGRGGGNNRGGYAARGRRGFGAASTQGAGRAGRGYGAGRGNYGNNGFGGGRHYAQGESSGTAGMVSGHHDDNWGGMNANFQRGPNFNNNARFGNQQRWNSGRGGGFQYRPRVTDTGVSSRTGIDADLLQRTVQAVVAAMTAATKAVEPSAAPVSHAAVVDGDRGQQVVMPVAAPTTSQLPTVISQGPQDNQGVEAKGKENEGQGAQKKKKEDKAGCFRLETTQGSQEVNMAEANNGNDGNDDANNGEESHGGGNAMDMDPKGVDEGNTSNNNGKEGTYEKNGVEGMQVQSNHVDAIQIGSMKLPITPTDSMARVSTSGLPQVAGVAAAAGLPLADIQLSAQRPAVGVQTAQQPAAADQPRADSAQRARQAEALPANGVQGTGVSVGSHAPVGGQRRSGPAPETGSAVAAEKRPRPLCASSSAQKILETDAAIPAVVFEDSANHWPNDEPMMGPVLVGQVGSSVHSNAEGNGLCLHTTMVGKLEKPMDCAKGNAMLDKKGEKNTVDLQGRMRNASPMKTTGTNIHQTQ
ncbi:hypothetical protein ACQ4PT_056551 [Festuca glaucescens]